MQIDPGAHAAEAARRHNADAARAAEANRVSAQQNASTTPRSADADGDHDGTTVAGAASGTDERRPAARAADATAYASTLSERAMQAFSTQPAPKADDPAHRLLRSDGTLDVPVRRTTFDYRS